MKCAEKENLDYIITRDEKNGFYNSPVKIISPEEFLKKNAWNHRREGKTSLVARKMQARDWRGGAAVPKRGEALLQSAEEWGLPNPGKPVDRCSADALDG